MKSFTRLIKKEEVAENSTAFYFEKPKEFVYKAGQFCFFNIPEGEYTPKRLERHFSIASAPDEDYLMFVTRMREGSDYKQALKRMPTGAEIELKGPYGSLVLPDDSERSLVFLAGGIGIAPFRSLIVHAHHNKIPHRMNLFYSNRVLERAAFFDEFLKMGRESDYFVFVPVLDEPASCPGQWMGEVGFISDGMIKRHCDDWKQALYYIAGPPPMVDAMKRMVENCGIGKKQVIIEKFTGY